MRLLPTIISALTLCSSIAAQPKQLILHQEEGRVTFAVDEVTPTEKPCGLALTGRHLCNIVNPERFHGNWRPELICGNIIDSEESYYYLGQDVVFQMLIKAWCEHRPVELSPDVIWLLICQQYGRQIKSSRPDYSITTDTEFIDRVDWDSVAEDMASRFLRNTKDSIATIVTSDFSTTSIAERIASQMALTGTIKPHRSYLYMKIACGIPSITITGTPSDWRNLLEKTVSLKPSDLDWWIDELEPILEEFIAASEGQPDQLFWKGIVRKVEPEKAKRKACSCKKIDMDFDGWFLKLFPYNDNGKTDSTAKICPGMMSETVTVPFLYRIESNEGALISETPMGLVSGVIGLKEDINHTLVPVVGWFITTALPENEQTDQGQSVVRAGPCTYTIWDNSQLDWNDFKSKPTNPDPFHLECSLFTTKEMARSGNLKYWYDENHLQVIPEMSWCRPYYRNATTLLYLQNQFGLWKLSLKKGQNGVASLFDDMRNDTRDGRDSLAVCNWANLISAELSTAEKPKPITPKVSYKGSAMGCHIGIDYSITESDFYKIIGGRVPGLSSSIGLNFMLRRIMLEFDGKELGGRCERDFQVGMDIWEKGEKVSGIAIGMNLGYSVYESNRLRVTPFAGIGSSQYSYQPVSWEKKGKDASSFRGSSQKCGIYFDIKLSRKLNNPYSSFGYQNGDTMEETIIRPYISVSHTQFGPVPSPWSFSFGVSWNFLYWSLKE